MLSHSLTRCACFSFKSTFRLIIIVFCDFSVHTNWIMSLWPLNGCVCVLCIHQTAKKWPFQWGVWIPQEGSLLRVNVLAHCKVWGLSNCVCVVAMRPFAKLLWTLVALLYCCFMDAWYWAFISQLECVGSAVGIGNTGWFVHLRRR